MRAPSTAREHFVDAIADELRLSPSSKAQAKEKIRTKLDVVQRIVKRPPEIGWRDVNRKWAKTFLPLATRLHSGLELAPPQTLKQFFYPFGGEEHFSDLVTLLNLLGTLASRCNGVIKTKAGEDPRFGRKQHYAALCAYELFLDASTERPSLETLMTVSNHVYEAVTGHPAPKRKDNEAGGLERACRDVLRNFRAGHIRPKKT